MPADISAVLQSLVTKTATFNSTGFDLITRTPKRGLVARFAIPSLISAGTAGAVFTPSIEQSDDNSTFIPCAPGIAITGGITANTTLTPSFIRFFTNKRYVRAVMTVAAGSGTPSVVYQADIMSADQ